MPEIALLVSSLVYYMIEVYKYTLIIYIVMSFFYQARQTRLFEFFRGAVEPLLHQLRFLSYGGISFAPIIIFLAFQLIQTFLIRTTGVIGVG